MQILCHIHIIIHHQNLRSIHLLVFFRFCFHRAICTQWNLHHPLLLLRNFHLIIYRPVHRQEESELHTVPERSLSRGLAHLMHILHHDRTMMKLHKALYIIKSDARTPTVKIRILRICQLVISLEHILQFILLYRLAAVKDWYHQHFFLYTSLYSDNASRFCMLQGIGKEIAQNLFQFI